MKYHVTPAGDPKVCRATMNCPYGDLHTSHFEDAESARVAFEAMMDVGALFNQDVFEGLSEDKKRQTLGGIGRVLSERGKRPYWQAVYDSSLAGQLWLERKSKEGGKSAPNPEWTERSAYLKSLDEGGVDLNLRIPQDAPVELPSEFSNESSSYFPTMRHEEAYRTRMALLSAAWMKDLTPEETEAVSWMTSNGSSVVNHFLSGEPHPIWGPDVYSEKHLEVTVDAFRRAMKKAPELAKPIIVYRGTASDFEFPSLMDRPASCSLSGAVARSFRGDLDLSSSATPILLEIKTRKIASVVGMSAWGASELETLAPLGRYRKVGEFTALRGRVSRGGTRKPIDPDIDEVRIVQVEYLGP